MKYFVIIGGLLGFMAGLSTSFGHGIIGLIGGVVGGAAVRQWIFKKFWV